MDGLSNRPRRCRTIRRCAPSSRTCRNGALSRQGSTLTAVSLRHVRALIGSSPRVIADDVWAKLLWAGLNLTPEDFARKPNARSKGAIHTFYPMEMIRALTLVWLFAGLRGDEIRRLRVGCVRWQQDNASSVCFLDVPVSKTGTAFTKPVDQIVGQAINTWEKVRPHQPKLCDPKTGEMVDFLFLNRMRGVGPACLNAYLIPKLCRKAGVPQSDIRGRITSHRARSTIATQLFNAKEPVLAQPTAALHRQRTRRVDWHGSLRRRAFSWPSTAGAGTRGAIDSGAGCEALREDQQERLHRC